MELKTLTYLVVGASFVLYIGIAIWSRASTTGDFYVAGKGVHPLANGMATAADWMSAASFISMAGLIAFLGYDGSVYLMGWTGGYVLLALLLAPYLRKFGKFTVPEFIAERYDSRATFFFLGWVAERHPDWVRRCVDAGHEVASHGWRHAFLEDLGPEGLDEDLARTEDALVAAPFLPGGPVESSSTVGFSFFFSR